MGVVVVVVLLADGYFFKRVDLLLGALTSQVRRDLQRYNVEEMDELLQEVLAQ